MYLTVLTKKFCGSDPHVTVTLVFGQVATIPIKAVGTGAAVAAPAYVTVKTPVGAAVTFVQGPKEVATALPVLAHANME